MTSTVPAATATFAPWVEETTVDLPGVHPDIRVTVTRFPSAGARLGRWVAQVWDVFDVDGPPVREWWADDPVTVFRRLTTWVYDINERS
jgi:hypothetical protein